MPKRTAENLTAADVKNLKPTGERVEVADGDVAGLYLVMQASGTKSWALRYRVAGKSKKYTFGGYPDISLKDARIKAREAVNVVKQGGDPADEKPVAALVGSDAELFENVFADFTKRYVERQTKPRTQRHYRNNFALDVLPVWTGRSIHDLKRRDVQLIMETMMQRGAGTSAAQLFTQLKKFFNWLVEEEVPGFDFSPIAKMKKPVAVKDRDRVLSDNEIRLVWLGAERIGYPYGPVVKVLLLSAQRRLEVGDMPRSEIVAGTEECPQPHWIIAKERTKNGLEHTVPLTADMHAILAELPKLNGNPERYFCGVMGGPLNSYSDGKEQLDAAILDIMREEAIERGGDPALVKPLEHWVLHDLRRTAVTKLAATRKVEQHEIEAILNHVSTGLIKGVLKTYNRYKYFDEKRAALELWGSIVNRIVSPADNVVALRA